MNLRTDVASGRGLLSTLSEYLEEFGKQAKIPVELVVGDGAPANFPSALEVQLVRIVQEALTNVRKHARATMAWVRLEADADEAVVIVEDNGEGFSAKELVGQERQHFGLQTMQERAESVGGALAVESAPGTGTRVIIRIPLANGGAEAG